MEKIDRREAIFRVATLMGTTLSASTLTSLLVSCETKKTGVQTSDAQLISDQHQKMIAEISERILPTTSTPGAKAAKVPEFIVVMISDCYNAEDQKRFFAGLDQLNADAQKSYKQDFLDLQPTEQTELLKKAETDAKALRERDPKAPTSFIRTMKELTLVGYFTSEVGATQALAYVQVPGRYEGCAPLKPGQKAWAT